MDLLTFLPTASWSRQTHDRLLATVLTASLVGLVTETFLRINNLLPLLPRLDVSVILFGSFVTLAVGGTLVLALTAPAHAEAEAPPRGVELDREGRQVPSTTRAALTPVTANPAAVEQRHDEHDREPIAA